MNTTERLPKRSRRWVYHSPKAIRDLKRALRRARRRDWRRLGEDAPRRNTKGWSD